jgi:DNA polymerase-3 subunit delta'
VLDRIVGQDSAVHFLRASLRHPLHAYLFIGPPGTGREEAATVFAAALFCPHGGCGECEVCRTTLARRHPDLVVVERRGAAISVPQAQEVARLASRTPRAAPYQVLVLVDFHLLGSAAPTLLKTIEEPPESTVIVVTAESVPADFVTIASRCARVEFRPLTETDLVEQLVREGVDRALAQAVAQSSHGRLDRARVALGDAGFLGRMARWREVPLLLDGTGATVVQLAAELVAGANETVEAVKARQTSELEQLTEEARAVGERSIPGRAELDARHRREQRRARTDDLLAGFAAVASVYRGRLVSPEPVPLPVARAAVEAIELIDEAASRLMLNVNESLLLEWLFVKLGHLGQGT